MRIAKAILFRFFFFFIIFSTCSWSLGSCRECERRSLPHPRCAGTGQAGVHREDLQSIIVERSNRLSGTSRATNWQASQGKKHFLHGHRKISCSCVVFALKSRSKVSGLRLSWVVVLCSWVIHCALSLRLRTNGYPAGETWRSAWELLVKNDHRILRKKQ